MEMNDALLSSVFSLTTRVMTHLRINRTNTLESCRIECSKWSMYWFIRESVDNHARMIQQCTKQVESTDKIVRTLST